MSQFLQLSFSGLTVGATYALAALGFSIIYNASGVINFAQGEFIMLGGMIAAFLTAAGLPLPLAVIVAIALVGLVGLIVEKVAIEPAGKADATGIVIVTIGVSMILRGLVEVTLGKGSHALPSFSGDTPFAVMGATILPQSLWVMAATVVVVIALALFFGRTRVGKGILATAHNRIAAQLVGVDTKRVLLAGFGLSAALGAIGGILIAPIATTSYDAGIMLGLKGFVAATLGGLGSGVGAVAGGVLLGMIETFTAGYVSSAYKDAVPFVLVLVILVVRPRGLFGLGPATRV
ncbi:MAG: branched-chain amino acid ABC transporter permease [Phyllobacteriaceae bacterium]|nr:branched-chain amino acid ABC transporter permease [Phyllobacteriaceae bacterium]